MKAQSFEYQLRHTTPPLPSPEARLRARRAALAEFEHVHASSTPARRGRWFTPASWISRSTLLGGLATACVVVIGVSVAWLMPPEQRQIQVHVPVASQPRPLPERAQQPGKRSEPALVNAPPTSAPVEKKTEVRSAPAGPTPNDLPSLQAQTKAPSGTARAKQSPARVQVPPPPVEMPLLDEVSLEQVTVTSAQPAPAVTMGSPMPVMTMSGPPGVVVPPPYEGRDKFQHFDTNPVKRVTDDPVSTFSVDVDTASYSFVRRQLNQRALPQVDAVRVEEMINYFDYAWPAPDSRDPPFKPTITVSDSPWGQGKKLIHIGIKGYALPVRQQPDVNLVLLLDVSGSMSSPDKLPLAQGSMALLLDSLKPSDTVAIVVYASAEGQVLAPTPVRDKEKILQALYALQPGGSTAGAAGIKLAYELAEKSFRKEGVNRILLATDGDFNVGITDLEALKGYVSREREKGVYLSVLGFGEGNYRDDMAQTLAQNGNGVAAYIDTLNEAKKVLVQESTASLFTIAKDVKLQVEFNPATVAEYRLVGYETRALNREDFNNDKVDAGDVGSGHTVTAIYEITPVGSKAQLVDDLRYEGSPRLSPERRGKANEYGFLKIRYKLPNDSRSKLLKQPILVDAGVPRAVAQDVEFSTAVAGFAQLLRGGQYTGPLSYVDVLRQAQRAVGEDPYGYRAEFVELVGRTAVRAKRAVTEEEP